MRYQRSTQSARLIPPVLSESMNVLPRLLRSFVPLALSLFALSIAPAMPVPTSGIVRGVVKDSSNGQPVPHANVVLRGTSLGAATNSAGFFHISAVPPGAYTLVVSQVGYQARNLALRVQEDEITEANVLLVPSVIEEREMLVVGAAPERLKETSLTLQKIAPREIGLVPAGAEPDIFRSLQVNPGVATTGDISARYFVRGGASDQNLVLLNGATVYNPFHTLGIFSVVDPEMVSLLEFHKGGFPPSYGGRLSSILNVVTRDGNKNEFHAIGSASLLSGKLAVEGPIPHGSFLLTGRKSWFAGVMKKYLNNRDIPFDFYDMSWKFSYADPGIDENSTFALHGFLSGDQVRNDDPLHEDYSLRNVIAGLNWRKIWSSPLYSVISISYSGFSAALMPNLSPAKPRENRVVDVTADWDFTYLYDSRDELNFGSQNKFISTALEQENLFGNRFSFDQRGFDMSAYADYRFNRWESVSATIGIRFKFAAISEIRPILFEPRGSITYRLTPSISLRTAMGWYSQELVTVADENELLSVFEPWIITPEYLYSERAFHLSTGGRIDWSTEMLTELEAYYKPITGLIEENPKKFTAKDKDFVNVDGESYGLEFLTQYQSKGMFAKVSYALSWAFKSSGGVRTAPRYDARHALHVLAGYDLGSGWEVSATWTYRTGMPFTPIAGFFDRVTIDPWSSTYDLGPQVPATLWGKKNSGRMPAYHRLDLSIARQFNVEGVTFALGASILNLYDRRNIFYFDRETGNAVYMLRLLPSISLRAEL